MNSLPEDEIRVLRNLGFGVDNYFGYKTIYLKEDSQVKVRLDFNEDFSLVLEEGVWVLYQPLYLDRLEDYFQNPLKPVPEENELFKMEFGIDFPIPAV